MLFSVDNSWKKQVRELSTFLFVCQEIVYFSVDGQGKMW